MTALYVESSAVLTWLLGEPNQSVVLDALMNADEVVTASLTAVECARGLARARIDRRISAVEEQAALRLLDKAVLAWNVLDLTDDVAVIAAAAFPREPVRTVDAIHLATALLFRDALGELEILSLDERVRVNALVLGIAPIPR